MAMKQPTPPHSSATTSTTSTTLRSRSSSSMVAMVFGLTKHRHLIALSHERRSKRLLQVLATVGISVVPPARTSELEARNGFFRLA
jgi:hypothetical protein